MTFKMKLGVLFLSVILLSSCANESHTLSDKAAKKKLTTKIAKNKRTINMFEHLSICTKDIKRTTRKFFNGQMSASELKEFWNCAQEAIEIGKNFIEGTHPDIYTKEDLKVIFEELIFTNEINIEFIEQFLAFKNLITGGKTDHLDRDDLDRLKSLLAVVGQATEKIRPHVPYLSSLNQKISRHAITGAVIPTPNEITSRKIERDAQEAIELIRDFFKEKSSSKTYDLKNIADLLTNLSKYTEIKSAHGWGQFLIKIKTLLISETTQLRHSDWDIISKYASDAVVLMLNFSEIRRNTNVVTNDKQFFRVKRSGTMILDTLDDILSRKPNHRIHNKDLFKAIDILETVNVDPEYLELSKDVWETLFSKVLIGHKESGDTQAKDFLHRDDIQLMREQYNSWVSVQEWINQQETEDVKLKADCEADFHLDKETQNPRNRLIQFVGCSSIPLKISKGLIYRNGHSDNESSNIETLSLMNALQSFLMPFMKVYAKDSTPDYRTSMSQEELLNMMKDMEPILETFNIINKDKSVEKFVEEILLQVDLLLPASNGDTEISFLELNQYILHVYAANTLSQNMKKHSTHCAKKDAKANEQLDSQCLHQVIIDQRKNIFIGLNSLLNQLNVMSKDDRNLYFKNMEKVVLSDEQQTWFGQSDLVKLGMSLYFIENFIERADTIKKNDVLSYNEVLQTYVQFKPILTGLFLEQLSELPIAILFSNKHLVLSTYIYLVCKGNLPDPETKPEDTAAFYSWLAHVFHRECSATRLTLTNVLQALKEATTTNSPQ